MKDHIKKAPQLTAVLAAQAELFQVRDRLARIEAIIDQQRAARAAVIADDSELAELKRMRQRLLADRGLAETDDARRAADQALAAHDADQAKRQSAADEVNDTLAGLEHERERMLNEQQQRLQRLMDAQREYLETVTGARIIDSYLSKASDLYDALVDALAVERLAVRFGVALRTDDADGTKVRTRRVQLLYGDPATLPRPGVGFRGRDRGSLPPERDDNYSRSLWNDSDLDRAAAAREQQLRAELQQLGIEIV